jgi:hypothetical protein
MRLYLHEEKVSRFAGKEIIYLFDPMALYKPYIFRLGRFAIWIAESRKLDDIVTQVAYNVFIPYLPSPSLLPIYLSGRVRCYNSLNKLSMHNEVTRCPIQ